VSARTRVRIHPTAEVAESAQIGAGTAIWNFVQVREGTRIGADCILGSGAYIDAGVLVGDRCKLQNGVFVYKGFSLENGVFLGPGVMLLNDKVPRAVTPDGSLKRDADWTVSRGVVMEGAAVGGGSVILPGVTLGRYCLVGAGSVVTRDVPDHGLVYGNPARLRGFVCHCGQRLGTMLAGPARTVRCQHCGRDVAIPSTETA
jgi:acetyltransferase-like isoleucine patch superfamily enzyme